MDYETKVKKYFKYMPRYVEYDNDIKKFVKANMPSGSSYENVVFKYLNKHKNSVVLDCGFGAGGSMMLFSKNAKKVYGIDFTKKRVTEFRKKAKLLKLNNLIIQEGDVRKLRYKNEFFDLAYSFSVLFYLTPKEHEEAIKEMYRVTKKGGLCVIDVGNSLSIFTATWNRLFFRDVPLHCITYNQASKIITKAGFRIKEVYGYYLIPNFFPKIINLSKLEIKNSLLKRFAFHLFFVCEKR